MIPRAALVLLFVTCLLCFPATASQPEGLVGKLITNPLVTTGVVDPGGLPPVVCGGFHWSELFSTHQLDRTDTVTVEMAIIPFRSGGTAVVLHEAVGSSSFVQFEFRDGLVNGLPYQRFGWNDVVVHLRPSTQDYMMAVNGALAGPFAYESYCLRLGGCFTIQGFGLSGSSLDNGAIAWVDSISLVKESPFGLELLFEQTFHTCSAPHVSLGGLLISEPPQHTRGRR